VKRLNGVHRLTISANAPLDLLLRDLASVGQVSIVWIQTAQRWIRIRIGSSKKMRAIGASSWVIFRLFISEGLILGWPSWLPARGATHISVRQSLAYQ